MTSLDITRIAELSLLTGSGGAGNLQSASRQTLTVNGNSLPQQQQQVSGEISREVLEEAVSQITDYVQSLARQLSFSIDDSTGNTVVTVLDRETEQVIRQMPSEEALAISRFIAQQLEDPAKGLLVQSEV